MNNATFKLVLALAAGIVLSAHVPFVYSSDNNPHTISATDAASTCNTCHKEMPTTLSDQQILNSKNLPVDLSRFKLDGVAMCSSCHNPNEGHKVGLNIDFPVPADMPLSQENDIICLTCHYTHGRLDTERPQASFSFMDRLMDSQRLHKSFLLRRNNSDGELCLTCHNVNQGSK